MRSREDAKTASMRSRTARKNDPKKRRATTSDRAQWDRRRYTAIPRLLRPGKASREKLTVKPSREDEKNCLDAKPYRAQKRSKEAPGHYIRPGAMGSTTLHSNTQITTTWYGFSRKLTVKPSREDAKTALMRGRVNKCCLQGHEPTRCGEMLTPSIGAFFRWTPRLQKQATPNSTTCIRPRAPM